MILGGATTTAARAVVARFRQAVEMPPPAWFTCQSSTRRFYLISCVVFAVFCLVLYRVEPRFLPQSLDAQNFYFFIDAHFKWRSSWADIFTYMPLHGTGSFLWPVTVSLIPHLAAFQLFSDPTLRIYACQVIAATMMFATVLYFYTSIGLRQHIALAATWLSFALVMVYSLSYISSPDNLQPLVFGYLALALFIRTGRRAWRNSLVHALLFELAALGFVLAVPAWHIIALPFFGMMALAFLLRAESRRESMWKLAAASVAIAIQVALQTGPALFYTMADTFRLLRPDLFPEFPHNPYLAGFQFGSTSFEIALMTAFLIGLGATRLSRRARHPGLARTLHLAMALFFLISMVWSFVFLYAPFPSVGPKPRYLYQYALPLFALFAIQGVARLRRAPVDPGPAVGLVAVALLFAWHLATDATRWPQLVLVLVLVTIGWAMIRDRAFHLGLAVIAVLTGLSLHAWVGMSFGGGGDDRFDGRARFGLVSNPLIEFLHARVGLVPGTRFFGYVEDAYTTHGRDVGDEIVAEWGGNLDRYGNGMKLFSWNVLGIPTVSEYQQYTRPLFGTLFTHFLNRPDDVLATNFLSVTRPNARILAMLGVRYLVIDRDGAGSDGATEVFHWERFRVFELARPNLASYSPTEGLAAGTAAVALDLISRPDFDPVRQAVVDRLDILPTGLSVAPPARLTFERGGFTVVADSPGRSLIVLPVQFSHCLEPRVLDGDAGARLIRVNLAQTGLVFEGHAELQVRLRRWPQATPACQELDYTESRALLTRGAKGF